MTLGSTTANAYGEASYWDSRYSQDSGPFDWYQKYRSLLPLLDLYVRRHFRILLVGCGNSELGEEMINDGYGEIVNIDISSVVIEAMRKKYEDKPALKYIKMDVRDMSKFDSGSFDAVVDKGTLDSLMCGHGAQENTTKMLEEVGRVLKDKGVYILITYGDPSYRLYLLRLINFWKINIHVIEKLPSILPGLLLTEIRVPAWTTFSLPDNVEVLKMLLLQDLCHNNRLEKTAEKLTWELTTPIPWNEDGTLATEVLGPSPEVHYIYVCSKDVSLRHQSIVEPDNEAQAK